ncbi:MAG: GNAT family N-acetyltransferase [Bacteroidota bacterium]
MATSSISSSSSSSPVQQVTIVPFNAAVHQQGAELLLAGIAAEYPENFYSRSSKLLPAGAVRYHWAAEASGILAGTVAVIIFPEGYAALKSMFLDKAFRGAELQVAARLLATALDKAREHKCHAMYLGTMQQFVAAQRFYEKNGFELISENSLPGSFPANDVDTVFYGKAL